MVEALQPCNVERSPATQEDGRGHTGTDEEVEVLGQVVVAKVHTRIFGVVASGQLALGFGKVERATVTLGIACNEVDDESQNGGHVAAEDVPAFNGLLLADFAERHRARQTNHGEHRHADGQFVADNLRTRAHGTDERILIVGRPTGQQDAHHANTGDGQEEEHADVEVNHVRALVPRQAGKGHHRGRHHKEGGQVVQEHIGLAQVDDFLRQHFEYVAEHLQRSPRADTHRAKATLEGGADFALHVDQDDGKYGIECDNGQGHQHRLCQNGCPLGDISRQEAMEPT